MPKIKVAVHKGFCNNYPSHVVEVDKDGEIFFERFRTENDAGIAAAIVSELDSTALENANVFTGDGVVLIRYSDDDNGFVCKKFQVENNSVLAISHLIAFLQED